VNDTQATLQIPVMKGGAFRTTVILLGAFFSAAFIALALWTSDTVQRDVMTRLAHSYSKAVMSFWAYQVETAVGQVGDLRAIQMLSVPFRSKVLLGSDPLRGTTGFALPSFIIALLAPFVMDLRARRLLGVTHDGAMERVEVAASLEEHERETQTILRFPAERWHRAGDQQVTGRARGRASRIRIGPECRGDFPSRPANHQLVQPTGRHQHFF